VPSIEKGSTDTGGLATGLLAALREAGGMWFGWSGEVVATTDSPPHIVRSGRVRFATIDLSRADYDQYYAGYSNRVLWPLFHFRPDLVEFKRQDLAGYLRVNTIFAAQLAPLLNPEDQIWVHDYHLIPLGAELRRLGVTQPLGFFLHTPFPTTELLRVLPNCRQLMEQLCAYDLIGFHTAPDAEAFRDYLVREGGAAILPGDRVKVYGRMIEIGVFPIGIDVDAVTRNAAAAEGALPTRRLKQSMVGRELIIGVDRLDYSKGLVQRFDSFSRMLERFPHMRSKVTLLQIAPPSRTDVPEYMEIRRALEEASGRINGIYSDPDWTPVRYLNKSFPNRTLMGFLRASRVGLVTPFRDGMNLVAKEYVAAQEPDDPGVLVLSCFAGAARELRSALLVNPFDLDGMAEALAAALQMSLDERKERWEDMMTILRRHDIGTWRESFLGRLRTALAA
jgi:trehalose 6-phosphate synthase